MPVIFVKKDNKVLRFIIIVFIVLAIFFSIRWVGRLIYPIKHEKYIIKYSSYYNIDPLLVASIIRVESKYYKNAESSKGARGLMQISRITGQWAGEEIGIKNYSYDLLFNPEINIMIGCWYLNKLKQQFNNKFILVIAAYNGGSGNVTKWLSNEKYTKNGEELIHIPFNETDQYVKKVQRTYKIYNYLYELHSE